MSTAPYETQPSTQPQPESSSSGGGKCLLFGCLGVTVVLLLVCGGSIFGGYFVLKGQVTKYTSDVPAELPVVELSQEQVDAIKLRSNTFKETIESGGTPDPLVLTAEEINAMIADQPEMKGRVFVRIEDGKVNGDVSIPADAVPGGAGRYFNASASFKVSVDDGYLIVRLDDATVKGEALPQEFIQGLRQENLAKDVGRNNPEVAEFLSHIESLTVEGDKIILTPKQADNTKESPNEESSGDVPQAASTPTDSSEVPAEATAPTDSSEVPEAAN